MSGTVLETLFPGDDERKSVGSEAPPASSYQRQGALGDSIEIQMAEMNGRLDVLHAKLDTTTSAMQSVSESVASAFQAKLGELKAVEHSLETAIGKLNFTLRYRGLAIAFAVVAGLGVMYGAYRGIQIISSFVDTVKLLTP